MVRFSGVLPVVQGLLTLLSLIGSCAGVAAVVADRGGASDSATGGAPVATAMPYPQRPE